MKIKLWEWGCDLNKEDAKIAVPLVLLLLGLTLTPLNKTEVWIGAVAYYLLYFFLSPFIVTLKSWFSQVHHWMTFRCPHCKSRDVFLQAYDADEPYAIHFCYKCGGTSLLVNDRLVRISREQA